MATREENLKKINEQLEKLSDDELEKVAGGGIYMIDPKNPNADPAANLLGDTAGYRPKCMPKDSPL